MDRWTVSAIHRKAYASRSQRFAKDVEASITFVAREDIGNWRIKYCFEHFHCLGGFIRSSMENIDTTPANVLKVKKYVETNLARLEPEFYQSISPIAGLLAPVLKEAALYSGIINPTPERQYQDKQYLFDLLLDGKDKLNKLFKSLKLTSSN